MQNDDNVRAEASTVNGSTPAASASEGETAASQDANEADGSGHTAPSDAGDPPEPPKPPGDSAAGDAPESKHGEPHPLAVLAQEFVHRVQDMREAAVIALPVIGDRIKERHEQCWEILNQHGTVDDNGWFSIAIPDTIHDRIRVRAALNESMRVGGNKMLVNLTRSLFVGLFSEFDAFIGNLLKILYDKKPILLNSINRELTLSEVIKYNTIESLKKDSLEREIDSFRRESYIDQFSLLENKFKIATLRKFPEWSEFVEMSQRRNLMTHNDGVVSDQYLKNCKQHSCEAAKGLKAGEQLNIEGKYFARACHVLSVVAFMLAYTLWRKVLPKDSEDANVSIHLSVYEWLCLKRWTLAARLGEFSLTREMIDGADDLNTCMRIINLAIAYKKSDKNNECVKILDSKDWTATVREFKLANAILRGNYKLAAEIMIQIGQTGEIIKQDDYYQWPLFIEFRESTEFQEAYKQIYNEEFDAGLSEYLQTPISNRRAPSEPASKSTAPPAEIIVPGGLGETANANATPGDGSEGAQANAINGSEGPPQLNEPARDEDSPLNAADPNPPSDAE